MASHPTAVAEILQLLRAHGHSQYGREAVSQLEHALQAALLAENTGAPSPLIVAALLHDIGHLLHLLPEDAPAMGIDDQHESLAGVWLQERFGPAVSDPVEMHVDAKRYLCKVDPGYLAQLSEPSIISLRLQGGPMSDGEAAEFEARPYFSEATLLRRWDDAAKTPQLPTPSLEHFAPHLERALHTV